MFVRTFVAVTFRCPLLVSSAQTILFQSKLNDDLQSQRDNKWNVSCPCGRGMFFRSDAAQCVHENVCAKEELCGENEECLNVLKGDGYKCVCQLGFVRGVGVFPFYLQR